MTSVDQQNNSVSLSIVDIDLEEHHRKLRRESIIFEIVALDQENVVAAIKNPCPKCTSKLYRHGKTKGREVWTLAGMIVVKLVRLRCSACPYMTVPSQYLIADGLLSSLAEKFVELCRLNTFANAKHLLSELLGIDIPVMTLHRYVRTQTAYFDDEIVRATEALYACGEAPQVDLKLKENAPLYLGIDEGLVRDWDWCHSSDTKDEKKKFVTAYSAVFFDGRKCVSKPKDPESGRYRYKLTNRYGHASATTDIDQFFRELVMLSYRRGYTSNNKLFILTDGARYLTRAIETYFPGAVHLLDIFHLKRRIAELISETHPLFKYTQDAIHAYNPKALLKIIGAHQPTDEKDREKKIEIITYVTRNAQSIKNHKDPKTKVHGSAAAEKSVDLLIARRFKNRGMSWTEQGCEVLLQFQVLAYNGQLKGYWENRHRQTSVKTVQADTFVQTAKPTKTRQKIKGQAYYHQVRLIDCERTKGTNTSSFAK